MRLPHRLADLRSIPNSTLVACGFTLGLLGITACHTAPDLSPSQAQFAIGTTRILCGTLLPGGPIDASEKIFQALLTDPRADHSAPLIIRIPAVDMNGLDSGIKDPRVCIRGAIYTDAENGNAATLDLTSMQQVVDKGESAQRRMTAEILVTSQP